jgi:hypothetical protein
MIAPEDIQVPPPRATKKKATSRIGEAIRFILPATEAGGLDYQEYIRISAGYAVAFDGTVAAGFPVEEELTVFPHAKRLHDALAKCGVELTVAVMPNGHLSVKGGKSRFVIPALSDGSVMPPVWPDPNIAVISDVIKEGFRALKILAKDKAEHLVEASLLLQANTMVATDRNVLFEFWHGIDLPPSLVIPRSFADAVIKQEVPLIGFGYGSRSITFWYENGAWIRTQLYQEKYPDYLRIIDVPSYPVPCPPELFEAIETIASHSDADTVLIWTGRVTTNREDEKGAQYEVEGIEITPDKGGLPFRAFSPSLLKKIKPHCETVDFNTHQDKAFFFGGMIRGAIMGKRV